MTGGDGGCVTVTPWTNISAYRFAPLAGLKLLRERLAAACRDGGLRGTILLSTEGINLFVAGAAAEIERLLALLRAMPGLEGLRAEGRARAASSRSRGCW